METWPRLNWLYKVIPVLLHVLIIILYIIFNIPDTCGCCYILKCSFAGLSYWSIVYVNKLLNPALIITSNSFKMKDLD